MSILEFFECQADYGLAEFDFIWDIKYAKIARRCDDNWSSDSRVGCLEYYLDACNTRGHVSGAVSVLQVAIRIGLALRLNLNTSSLLMSDASFSSTLIDGHGSMNAITIYIDDEPSSCGMLSSRDWLRILSASQFSIYVILTYCSNDATDKSPIETKTQIDNQDDPYSKSIKFKQSTGSGISIEAAKTIYRQLVSYMHPSRLSLALRPDFIPKISSTISHLELSNSTISMSGISRPLLSSSH
jgi:hypothetical protein